MKLTFSLFLVLFCNILFSQETIVGVSFRPLNSFVNSNTVYNRNDSTIENFKRDDSNLKLNLSVEFNNKNNFYHLIKLGYAKYKRYNSRDLIQNNFKLFETESSSDDNIIKIGYGFGKYFNIYNEKIFVRVQNLLYTQLTLSNNSTIDKLYDKGIVIGENNSRTNKTPIYSLEYELEPTFIYKIKFFSIGLGIPLGMQLNTYNGKETIYIDNVDHVNNEKIENEYVTENKATYFYFNFDIELSLRFHIPCKKKEKKE